MGGVKVASTGVVILACRWNEFGAEMLGAVAEKVIAGYAERPMPRSSVRTKPPTLSDLVPVA
jgi:hypothetical protein